MAANASCTAFFYNMLPEPKVSGTDTVGKLAYVISMAFPPVLMLQWMVNYLQTFSNVFYHARGRHPWSASHHYNEGPLPTTETLISRMQSNTSDQNLLMLGAALVLAVNSAPWDVRLPVAMVLTYTLVGRPLFFLGYGIIGKREDGDYPMCRVFGLFAGGVYATYSSVFYAFLVACGVIAPSVVSGVTIYLSINFLSIGIIFGIFLAIVALRQGQAIDKSPCRGTKPE